MSDYWKKKMDELEKETKKTPSQSYWDRKRAELEEEKKRKTGGRSFQKDEDEDDIAPIKSSKDDGKLDFFQKGAFEDGYQFGDVTRTILGSVGDAGLNAVKGIAGLGEGIGDLISYGVAGVADKMGEDAFARGVREKAQENLIDNLMKPAEDYLDKYSILGRTSDAILQGVGQVGGILATGGLGAAAGLGTAGVTALTTGVMGLSGMGSGMGEAYQGGATDEEATLYGAISGTADAISELIFGGLGKAVNAVGLSKGLSSADDILAKKVSSMFSNQIMKNFSEFGIKAGAEGFEEVLAGIAQAAGKKATYMSEEEFGKILQDENLLEQFVVGAVTSGIAQTPGLHIANKTGSDFITGLNQNEQAVVKKEIENRIAEAEADGTKLSAQEKAAIEAQVEKDLEKGYISTDLIDEVVGGFTYQAYKDSEAREDALFQEYEELGKATNPTLAQQYRYRELDTRVKSIKDNDIRSRRKEHLNQYVAEQVSGSRLAESYNEKARKGQVFEADLTKYDAKQQAVIKKAVDSGILNNTNRTHEFVDMIAKISADKGVLFDFTNNEKLKNSGFAVDGKAVNGYVTKDGITVNIQSSKALNSIVGHEITHVLEGTDLYTELQNAVVEYAKTKGDYQGRFDSLSKLYEAVEGADINAELTADLVGDYLFTDSDFINNLSTNHRNVFQKIYDEVKYLLKVATAGSKEARELEKVKRAFEKAYREGETVRESEEISDSKTKYSIREEAPPKNTGVAYKVFYVKDGKLYPPMVANPGGADTPMGVWLNADMGTAAPPSKTGRAQVKAGGKGTQGGGGSLAFRPGWHLGDLPRASQFDRVNPETGKKELFPENFVWAEVEYAKDVDYQEEAMSYGYTDKGKFRHAYAGLPKLPENGYYRYRTNPKPDTVPWVITGAMKVNRLLSDAEVNAILEKNGVAPVHRQGGDVGLDKFGFNDDGTVKYSLSAEQQEFFKDSVVRDENGNLKVMYHGTSKGGHTVFDTYGSNYGLFGTGSYFTDSKRVAEGYTKKGKGKNPQVYEAYLNIKNPMDMDAAADPAQWAKAFPDADFPESGTNEQFYRAVEEFYADQYMPKWEVAEEIQAAIESGMGYDGITHIGGGRVNPNGERHQVYIAFQPEQIKNVDNSKPTENPDIRYSLSEDSDGNKLTEEQERYFRSSKMRDDNGNLKPMYHGTTNGGFHEFNTGYSDDGTSLFFVDSNTVAESYSGTSETYAAKTFKTAEDFNNFFAEIGADEYEVREKDGKFHLYEDGDFAAESDTAEGIYEEFRYWSGLGEGAVNYKVYLDLVNPLEVDAQGKRWDELPGVTEDKYEYIKVLEVGHGTVKVEYAMKGDPAPVTEDVFLYEKFSHSLAETLSNMAPGEMVEGADANPATTRDYAKYARENGYDGVIFKNIVDIGAYGGTSRQATVAIAFDGSQVKSVANQNPTTNKDIRYSLSDSNGKKMSAAQSEYFKDSKVRDENGNLMVMYHGTPNGEFTVFRDGTYFTASKEYADRYQNPGASSISTGKVASAPKTFEVYLDIKKPFDINDAEARRIYIEDYIKGGNAMGINPYLSDAEYAKINTIDWTEGEDLRDFLIENEYDYDGLVLDEGGIGGYGDEVQSRGKSYVVFSPEQVKNIDNQNPTSDPDIRFSLSEAVEETKDLMALHNLTEQKLLKSLKLGGLPMPSVAIAKAKDGHGEFGEISLILPKETIDPKSSSRNKLYSGDAWTPTYPKVDYKPSRKVLQEADDRISGLVPYEVQHVLGSLMFDTDNVTDALDRYNGNMVEAYKNNDAMKYAYLKDTGSDISLPMKEADLIRYGTNSNAAVRYFSGKLVNGLQTVELYQNMSARDMLQDKALTEAVADAQNFDVLRTLEPGSVEYLEYERNPVFRADEVSFRDIDNFLSAARKLLTNGIQQTVDRNAAKELIRNKVDQSAYESWLEKLFAGVVEKEGIRNNKDYFTPSGNRRSFEALHYEHNLENVIKAMREKGEKGIGNGFGGASIFGASTTEFSSIEEMKQSSDRLQTMSYDEYQELRKGFTDRFLDIAMSLPNQRNSFSATDSAAEVLTEAVAKYKTRSGIANYLRRELKGWATYSDQVVDDLIELVNDIRKMPTGYFEAKPQRAVGFEEVGVFVIPNDADVKLKQELLNRGYSIAEYDPKVEGDRQRVVNQFEEFKFSLADAGAAPKTYGSYNVYGKDIALEAAPVQEEIAPVAETAPVPEVAISKIETTTEEPVAPIAEESPVVEDLFPDDLAPVQQEMENLLAEQSELRQALESAMDRGDYSRVSSLTADYESVTARIREIQAQEDERLSTLGEADMPPEMEAPYPGEASEPMEPADPFAERDMHEVGSQKVKAYQYENPEVKPFFTEAALGMLDDLHRSTKGEKIFNSDVYYQSGGEEGWDGTKRSTTADIAALLDEWHYTYDQIEKGLNAIIEDNGKENNAVSKRIEFMLDDRLRNGYTDVWGERMPANQEYINLLNEKQITEYSREAFDSLFAQSDKYAPYSAEDDIAPVGGRTVAESVYTPTLTQKIPKRKEKAYESIRPKPEKKTQPVILDDDIAPVFGDKLVRIDSNNGRPGEKQRKWVGTSTESEAVNRQVLPDDLDQDKIYYQPISNKVTLNKANVKLDGMGYESSVTYFNSQFTNKRVSLEDVALGERLIQEAIKRGDTKTAGELIQNVAILGTELGQKVQALSMIQRMTPEGQLKMLQKTVKRGQAKGDKAYDGVVITQEMIDKILSAYGKDGSYDQAYLDEMVEDVKKKIADQMKVTAMDKVNAWRYLSMLGNPKTHIRNLVSNVAMRGTVAVKNALARTIESVAPIQSRTKTWAKPTEYVQSYAQKTAAEMKDIISDGGKYSEDSSIKQKRDIFKNRILNGLYEFNSDMLTKEDWWFSKTAFTKALSEYLTANGIHTHEDLTKNPKIVEKARVYATEQSQIATFRQYSWLANKINDIERHNAATNIAVGAIMPFKKTPINIAKTGLNYSPLGFAKTLTSDVSKVKNGEMEASELVDHLAQNITGSALTLVGYMLASSGFLSGAGEDDKEGEYDYQLGQQAYAINIGGKSYSLSWLSPIAMPLFVGANAYEQLVEGKEWNGDVVVETLAQTLDPLSEMSFLSGLDSVLSSYESGIQKFAGIGQTMVQNYATQFVPTLSSQVATVLDDTKRSTKIGADSDFKFVDQTINKLKYKIPFLRETLEPSTDIWGNDVKQTENVIARAVETFLAPYAAKESTATAVDEEIKALYRETGEDSIIPGIPNNSVTYKDQKYKMSADEYTAFKQTYGQTAFGLLEELFRTDTYLNATASDKADMVGKVYDYARDVAKQEFLAKKNVQYTNATSEGQGIYKEDAIRGAIEADMPVDEYTFSVKYPEKYALLEKMGINYDTYRSADEDAKDAYNWALENPDKYPMSKAVASDVVEYRQYTSALYDIKADKDASGKSISGSRKEKVLAYINGLDIDYGAKLILFKNEYNADDESNYEIIDYLNSRSDISYEEEVAILRELGFTVASDGTIYWD